MTPISDDEFENFLRRQTDSHRMYPSDKLWRNIQLTLHGESRWPALTYISILVIAALVGSTLLVKPEERMKKNAVAYASDYAYNAAKEKSTDARSKAALNNSPLQHAYTEKITQNTIEAVTKKLYEDQLANNTQQPALYKNDATVIVTKAASLPVIATPFAKASPQLVITDNSTTLLANAVAKKAEQAAPAKQASMHFSTLGLINFGGLKMNNDVHLYNTDNEEMWRKFALINPRDIIRRNLSKFSFQFYITPSVSYRRLTDAKGKAARFYTAIPLSANYKIDINNVVKHTPSAGAEVGFALGYKLNENFIVKSGLQFNVRQYNIEAYSRPAPSPVLQSGEAIGATPDVSADAYATSSDYIQTSGKPIILRNRYYEVAAPVGIDWKVLTASNGMITLNVAAALQPTYTFDKEPFVITTDYKKYTDGSAIMRNWNVNSSMEAYITYKVGPLRWQIGPQFRYQYLPTYGGGYPIREHLLDYGLKIGFTKALD